MKFFCAGFIVMFCVSAACASAVEDNRQGVDAMNAGRFDEAIQYLSAAHSEDPDNAAVKNNLLVAYNNAAMDCSNKGNFDAAYRYMRKAHELDPQSAPVNKNFANILTNEAIRRYKENNGQDIEPLLIESLEYNDSLAETHTLLGQVYYDNDEYADAQQHWQKVLSLDPSRAAVQQKLDKLNREIATNDRLHDSGRYHFKVRYEGMEMWTASQEVLDMLEDACNNAGWKLGTFPKEPVTVIIYTQEEFQTILGQPDWFAGAYDGKIRLRRSDVEGDKKRLRQLVYHEYMHAYIHYVAGNNVPTWLNEGLAQCYENMPDKAEISYGEKKTVKDRLAAGEMPPMDTIDKMFHSTTSQADVNFAYAFSKMFVAYLIEKGWDINIKNMLDELHSGSNLNDAFEKVFCRSIEQMRSDWLSEMKFDTTF
jgi:tetratricopeptide (TPR) repeat protein